MTAFNLACMCRHLMHSASVQTTEPASHTSCHCCQHHFVLLLTGQKQPLMAVSAVTRALLDPSAMGLKQSPLTPSL